MLRSLPSAPANDFAEDLPSSSPRDYLTVLFKRRKLILVFFVSVVLLVAAGTFLTAPTYEARASILVKKSRAEIPLAPKESNQLIINQVTREDVNSEIEILKSRMLLEDTLRDLEETGAIPQKSQQDGLTDRLRTMLGGQELTQIEKMVLQLQRKLEVRPVRNANIIEVRYRSKDPDWAAAFVRSLTTHYLERRTLVYQPTQAVNFFKRQTRLAEETLIAAEAAVGQFLASAGVTMVEGPQDMDSLAAEKEVLLQRLGELESRLSTTGAEIRERTERVAALRASLAREPERLASADRLNLDPAVEEIETRLVALELERDALIQDFKVDNRRVRDIGAQITLAEERLRDLQQSRGNINRTELSQIHQSLKGEMLLVEADLAGAKAEYAALLRIVAEYRNEVAELNEKGFVLASLHREANAAEDAYLLYRKKHEEARISAAMNEQEIIDVAIAQPAQRPLEPVAPKKFLNLALAITLGLLGGFGLAFLAELFDHTFTTREDVEQRLGIPVLASIPEHR